MSCLLLTADMAGDEAVEVIEPARNVVHPVWNTLADLQWCIGSGNGVCM